VERIREATDSKSFMYSQCLQSQSTNKVDISETEMAQILQWLVTTDPSLNHHNACELHEEHTGQWLTKSPEYGSWKSGHTRFLWIHGIPGAGKTVLLSYIAEDIKAFCENSPSGGLGWGYYYCYFARNQHETPSLLRWLINQLCRQIGGIPPMVSLLHKEGGHPQISRLVDVLAAISENFSRVYVVIDALDESANRERMLGILLQILENKMLDRIQFLATSRKELEIERALLPVAKDLSLSNPYVDEDIRTYIRNRLQNDPKYDRWPNSLKIETESTLLKGAKGM
jgi:hypothetical protein